MIGGRDVDVKGIGVYVGVGLGMLSCLALLDDEVVLFALIGRFALPRCDRWDVVC